MPRHRHGRAMGIRDRPTAPRSPWQNGCAEEEIARERRRTTLITGSSSSELTGRACSPYSTQWLEDTYNLSAGIVNGVFSAERRNWFFIAVDNAFGEAMVRDASQRLKQLGGMPFGT